jgi:isopenicillin-N epimerase
MSRRLRRERHGFRRADSKRSNIFGHYRKPLGFIKTSARREFTARIHELNAQMKEGLAGMSRVQLYTPRDENLSAGMVCFDVKGTQPEEVVERLLAQRMVASTTPYRLSYARVACSIVNTPQEVETVLRAIRELA